MFPSPLFEVINAVLATLALAVLFIFGRYMVYEWLANKFSRVRMSAAIAVFVLMLGEGLTRGWTWLARFQIDTDRDAHWMLKLPWGAIPGVGALITALAMLCLIRVFTPDEWGHRGWIFCAGLVAAVVIATQIFR